jgi:hypothetical protein
MDALQELSGLFRRTAGVNMSGAPGGDAAVGAAAAACASRVVEQQVQVIPLKSFAQEQKSPRGAADAAPEVIYRAI